MITTLSLIIIPLLATDKEYVPLLIKTSLICIIAMLFAAFLFYVNSLEQK